MPKDLREIMTDEIKAYGWLDGSYPNQPRERRGEIEPNEYVQWLNRLSAADFLLSYNWVRERVNSLT